MKNVVKQNISAAATLSHFPAVLCLWTDGAQIKRGVSRRQFAEQIRIEDRFLRLFGAVSAHIDAGWGDRSGAGKGERFPAVKRVVAETERGLGAAAWAGNAREKAG